MDDLSFYHKGGSAAQSTIIQIFDVFLSTEHEGATRDFIVNTRNYMPKKHRKLIDDMLEHNKVRDYIIQNGDLELMKKFNNCKAKLEGFRWAHKKLIDDYIFRFIMPTYLNHIRNSWNYFKTSLKHLINKDRIYISDLQNNTQGNKGTSGTNPVEIVTSTINATYRSRIPIPGIILREREKVVPFRHLTRIRTSEILRMFLIPFLFGLFSLFILKYQLKI